MRSTMITVVALLWIGLASIAPRADDLRGERTFSGTYDWKQGGSDELVAEFRPDGGDRWTVTFRFVWGGGKRSWQGTAEGTLEDGSRVEGTAGSGGRTWVFEAEIEDGVMRGSHSEIKGGAADYPTGTFELRP